MGYNSVADYMGLSSFI